jgi:hypothetical protein
MTALAQRLIDVAWPDVASIADTRNDPYGEHVTAATRSAIAAVLNELALDPQFPRDYLTDLIKELRDA